VRLYRSLWGIQVGPPPPPPPPSSPRLSSSIRQRRQRQPVFRTRCELLHALSSLGYSGIEASLMDLGRDATERATCARAIRDAGLDLIIGTYSSWRDYDDAASRDRHSPVDAQVQKLRLEVVEAYDLGASKVNCHSGSDSWTEGEALRFFESFEELRCSGRLGAPAAAARDGGGGCAGNLGHETHRGRPLGSPWTTYRLLGHLPELRLTSDYSHWVLSCERYFGGGGNDPSSGGCASEEEAEVMRVVTDRVMHVHARVGTTQRPQVGDVRTEIASNPHGVRAFTHHWTSIRDSLMRGGETEMSVTPEYGPHPYAPGRPGGQPDDAFADDVWDATEAAAAHVREVLEGRGGIIG
jgi:hypothetical protein